MLQHVWRVATLKLVPRNCLRYLQTTLTMGGGGLVSEFMWGIVGVSNEELRNLSYQKRCYLLNKNSVLVTRHIQYKVEVFFEEIILDDKTKYYATRITFQERSHPHVNSLYGFSIHQIFKMSMSTLSFLRKR